MASVKPSSDLTSLPFDQYSRQFVVAHLINTVLRSNKSTSFDIIDLGGHKGKTGDFLPRDHVTILDVFDESYEGYVKGDATNMDFADGHFDIATSFDVFEHIPRANRQAFINESLRVSKSGVFIALPVDSDHGAVSGAEQLLNTVHKDLYKEDHRWLKEHIDYRIPEHDEILALIKKSGAQAVSLASNQVTDWQLLQAIIFVAARNRHVTAIAGRLNTWYNKHISELELGVDPGYRRIYFITKDTALLRQMTKAVDALTHTSPQKVHRYLKIHESVLAETLRAVAAIGVELNRLTKAADEHEQANLQAVQKITHLQQQNRQLMAELTALRGSLSWRITRPLRAINKRLTR